MGQWYQGRLYLSYTGYLAPSRITVQLVSKRASINLSVIFFFHMQHALTFYHRVLAKDLKRAVYAIVRSPHLGSLQITHADKVSMGDLLAYWTVVVLRWRGGIGSSEPR